LTNGNDLVFHIRRDARLVLFQQLWLKFAVPIPWYIHFHVAHACFQLFLAVTVTTVVSMLVRLIAKLFIEFGFKPSFHEFRYCFLEQILDVIHAPLAVLLNLAFGFQVAFRGGCRL